MAIRLRSIRASDLPFLRDLYASTRAEELARVEAIERDGRVVRWTAADKRRFLDDQFEAQHRYYGAEFPAAEWSLVLAGGAPIGRLVVDRRADEIRIIDVALVPAWRGRGIGGRLLRDLLAEAGAARLPVRIHVERFNRALGLYERLGFRRIDDRGVYHLLEWTPRAHEEIG